MARGDRYELVAKIASYKALLQSEADPFNRAVLRRLLIEEEAKLDADLKTDQPLAVDSAAVAAAPASRDVTAEGHPERASKG
jgi:hypothetical protein